MDYTKGNIDQDREEDGMRCRAYVRIPTRGTFARRLRLR